MKKKKKIENFGSSLISWKAPEFREPERGLVWGLVMGFLALAMIAYGIIANSIAFSIVIILIVALFLMNHKHKARIVDIHLTENGLRFGHRFYSFAEIKVFWIIFDPPHVQTLNLRVKKGPVREIAIQLAEQDPAEVRALLGTEVPEWKNRTESFSEILIRLLKL